MRAGSSFLQLSKIYPSPCNFPPHIAKFRLFMASNEAGLNMF